MTGTLEFSDAGDNDVTGTVDPPSEAPDLLNEAPGEGAAVKEGPDLMGKDEVAQGNAADGVMQGLEEHLRQLQAETAIKDAARIAESNAQGREMLSQQRAQEAAGSAGLDQGGKTVRPTPVPGTKETGQESRPSPETEPA